MRKHKEEIDRKLGLAPRDQTLEESRDARVQVMEPEPARDSSDASDERARCKACPGCEVCRGLAEAREIHRQYLTMPPDPKTGSPQWHRRWIGLYDKALEASGCGCATIPPPTPPEEPEISEVLKTHIAVGPCILRLTKKEQRRINELGRAYLAGARLAPRDYFDLADYVECLSLHASPDGAEELAELSRQLSAQGCGPIAIPPAVELAEPEEQVSDIRRIPLELIDIRPEKYQYRRGGAEQPGLDKKHVQNIVETFDPDRMTPIEVRQVDSRYELLSGHHRLAAFKRAKEMGGFPGHPRYNVSSIPALIRQVDEHTARQLARLSNAQTKEYTPSEFARIVELELGMGIAPEAIARAYGNRKVSEIEKFHDIAALPDSLLDILDNPALRKTFTLDHAAVLGHAMREYDLAPAEVQMIFNRILREGEYTSHQLERMLKTLGPEIKEAQVDMFAGMELGEGKGGIVEALRDVMDAIKAQETQRRRLRSFSHFIEVKRKAGEAIPEELNAAYNVVQSEIDATTERIEELRISIGQRLKTMPVKEAIKAPAPPPLPTQARELAKELEKRVKADRLWAILEKNVDFGNLSYEDRDRIWNYKPLREVLAQAIEKGEQIPMESPVAPTPPVASETEDTMTAEEEAQMQERIRQLEQEVEQLKRARRREEETASEAKAGAEANETEAKAGETSLCPGCGKDVGWDSLPIKTHRENPWYPLPFRLNGKPLIVKGKRCPDCGHIEPIEATEVGKETEDNPYWPLPFPLKGSYQ